MVQQKQKFDEKGRDLDQQKITALQEQASLSDVTQTIPKECFRIDSRKAYTGLFINVAVVVLTYAALVFNPWFWLTPLLWVIAGTALTGFFVLAHDCGHRSFSASRRVNDFIGHLFMLPLLYPFHGWRVHHNQHHAYTNHVKLDNAWRPISVADFPGLSPALQSAYRSARGYGWWIASIFHQANLHFRPSLARAKDQADVRFSVTLVVLFAFILFPGLLWIGGPWAVIKYWLMPWLVYHFWMSTFTLVHHTQPDIPFYNDNTWNPVIAQLFSTVHCRYPFWVEFLCHDINVHIPHHVSTAIPSYNLRAAHEALKSNWSPYMHERKFTWQMMQKIVQDCHLYDETGYYRPCPPIIGPR